jgi:hypothetical protein
MAENNESFFDERKKFSTGDRQKIQKTLYKGAPEVKPVIKTKTKPTQTSSNLTKKDVFLMSFLAFFCAGLLLSALFFAGTTLTTNAISFDAFDFLGGEEVINGSTEEVAPDSTELVEEEIIEEIVEEEPEEEEVVVAAAVEIDEDCDEIFTLAEGASTTIAGKTVILKLSSSSAVQLSVGGKVQMMEAGDTEEINNINLRVTEASTEEATLRVVC